MSQSMKGLSRSLIHSLRIQWFSSVFMYTLISWKIINFRAITTQIKLFFVSWFVKQNRLFRESNDNLWKRLIKVSLREHSVTLTNRGSVKEISGLIWWLMSGRIIVNILSNPSTGPVSHLTNGAGRIWHTKSPS